MIIFSRLILNSFITARHNGLFRYTGVHRQAVRPGSAWLILSNLARRNGLFDHHTSVYRRCKNMLFIFPNHSMCYGIGIADIR